MKKLEVQNKGIKTLFNEMKSRKIPKVGKDTETQMQEVFKSPNKHDQSITPHCIIVKLPKVQNKVIVLKAMTEKHDVTYKGKPIRIVVNSQQKIQGPPGPRMMYLKPMKKITTRQSYDAESRGETEAYTD